MLEEAPRTLGFRFSKYICMVKKCRPMKNVLDLTKKFKVSTEGENSEHCNNASLYLSVRF